MTKLRRFVFSYDDDQEGADRQTASLGGLAVVLLLVVVGLFLIKELHCKAKVEDCLLAGRTNCDAVLRAMRRSLSVPAHRRLTSP
jgi:hypothetical protein